MVKHGARGMNKSYVCQVCGKEGQWSNIRDHIEMNHLEGISIPCNICNKIYWSRKTLSIHKSKNQINSISFVYKKNNILLWSLYVGTYSGVVAKQYFQ